MVWAVWRWLEEKTAAKQVISCHGKNENSCEMYRNEKCTCTACERDVVKYANLWRWCRCRRHGYVSSRLAAIKKARENGIARLSYPSFPSISTKFGAVWKSWSKPVKTLFFQQNTKKNTSERNQLMQPERVIALAKLRFFFFLQAQTHLHFLLWYEAKCVIFCFSNPLSVIPRLTSVVRFHIWRSMLRLAALFSLSFVVHFLVPQSSYWIVSLVDHLTSTFFSGPVHVNCKVSLVIV